jgi:hypothetical protein
MLEDTVFALLILFKLLIAECLYTFPQGTNYRIETKSTLCLVRVYLIYRTARDRFFVAAAASLT